jgi:hypothetical protein
VDTFITQPVHPGTDNIPIDKFVAAITRGVMPKGTTPFMIADRIDAHADAVLSLDKVHNLDSPHISSPELREHGATVDDIGAMAMLGKYYAAKIRGATELAWFRATGIAQHKERAVAQLAEAMYWARGYAGRVGEQYARRFWTNRVGIVDFGEFTKETMNDWETARSATVDKP